MDRTDDCASYRELISAALDGAATTSEQERVDAHVERCAGCRAFLEAVAALNRSLRLRPSAPDPAFVASVMADARPARLGRGAWMRPVLVWCALVIAVQSFAPLVLGESDGVSSHLARHLGASGLALAVGLAYAAWRPHRSYGLLPFVGALFAATALAAMFDVIDGNRSAFAETTHLAELIGIVVLWMIAGSPGRDTVVSHLPHRRSGHGSGALGPTK